MFMARKDRTVSAAVGHCGCIVLERLTKVRAEGFAAYLKARHLLASSASGEAGHEEVVKGFESALESFRANQRKWEEHVSEHHLG